MPAGLEAAWQPLALSVTSAGEAQAELFLGSHFTGIGTDLQEFLDAHAAGSHVLLPPGTLDSVGAPLTFDGMHLYGSLEGTQLDLGDLQIVVGLAPSASLNDLTLSVATADYLAALPDTQPLDPSWVPTAVTFERVDLTAGSFGDGDWYHVSPLPGALTLNASYVRADGDAVLLGLQGVNVSGSTVEAFEAVADSWSGATVIESSSFVGESMITVTAALEVTVKGSTLRVTNGIVQLFAGSGAVHGPPALKTLHLSTSVVEALGAESESVGRGNIEIGIQFGALEILDNKTMYARSLVEVTPINASGVTIQGNEARSRVRQKPPPPLSGSATTTSTLPPSVTPACRSGRKVPAHHFVTLLPTGSRSRRTKVTRPSTLSAVVPRLASSWCTTTTS
ncbi:MAG: hypothetical protein WDA15_03300 [Trueperaceae bacterium]